MISAICPWPRGSDRGNWRAAMSVIPRAHRAMFPCKDKARKLRNYDILKCYFTSMSLLNKNNYVVCFKFY